ncbi:MAG: hypothetical protein ACLUNR_02140 [Bacilli bacterium]|jgi:hypothetical protein|nr:MAG TPA: hypothetical protein [Bacteriophage sp.]DAF14715.1 MAG TPA: hypothetical protein [Crassvirales sp.]
MKLIKMTIKSEWLNEETGEILTDTRELKDDSVKKPSTRKSSSKKKDSEVDDTNPNPLLILEENKYILNKAAVEALGVEPGDKVDIKQQKLNKKECLVIGAAETFGTQSGNKLTQKNAVSYRGKNNQNLAEHGNEFTFTPHPKIDGLFILTGNREPEIKEDVVPEAEDIASEDELDDEMASLIDGNADDTEISDNDFNFDNL